MSRPFAVKVPLGVYMTDAGLNATMVSQATGIYSRTLTEYLSGRKQPTTDHLYRLADLLDVDPEDLIL